jgi:hypothetical protein
MSLNTEKRSIKGEDDAMHEIPTQLTALGRAWVSTSGYNISGQLYCPPAKVTSNLGQDSNAHFGADTSGSHLLG